MKHLMFSLLLIVLAVGMVNAQSATAVGTITAGVASSLSLEAGAIELADLAPGYTYNVYLNVTDGAWQMLVPGSAEVGEPAVTEFALADLMVGSQITISFTLPTTLLGEAGALAVSFPKAWFMPVAGDYGAVIPFNPNVPFTTLVGSPESSFSPEMTLVVPGSTPAGDYAGIMVCNVSYTGL